jgi:hypothetical protein
MKKTVIWAGNSQAQLAAIDRENAMRILHAIDDYLTDGSGDVKKLRPPRRDLRLRVGATASSSSPSVLVPSKSLASDIARRRIEIQPRFRIPLFARKTAAHH